MTDGAQLLRHFAGGGRIAATSAATSNVPRQPAAVTVGSAAFLPGMSLTPSLSPVFGLTLAFVEFPGWRLGLEIGLLVTLGWTGWRLSRELKRRTGEWEASEARFRELFENAIEGVYENPPEGGFRRANPALARILGYASVEELLRVPPQATALIYVSPTRREEFFAALGSADHIANFESEIKRPDGVSVWIKENVRAVRDARGSLLYLQGFVSDVTERKRTETELQESEERFRVLFEHSPIGMLECDYRATMAWLDGLRARGVTDLGAWMAAHPAETDGILRQVDLVGANAAARKLTGAATLAELRGNISRILTDETIAARRDMLAAAWAGRGEAEGEFALRSLEGAMKRVYYRWWVPTIEGQTSLARTQIALVDLTAIRGAQQALAAERERLSVTLSAMTEAVITVDGDGHVRFMNDAAGRLTGWAALQCIAQPLGQICPLQHATIPWVTAPAQAAMAGAGPVDLPAQTTLVSREGKSRLVEGQCAPIRDAGGVAIGAVLVMRDVTESSRIEAELIRASKMQSIGVLAGGIAHDFNNLLSIVMGNITLALLDAPTEATGGRWLREAERGALRARDLTQQLLTFAKGGDPVRTAAKLSDIVREAAEFALHGAAVKCEIEVAPDLRAADVDKGQIGQVVQNLVMNAVQAMPEGGVVRLDLRNETLAAGAVPTLPAGEYVRFEVADCGVGIAPQHILHIFEPFFTTKEHGSGLGLATVYSIIQKHRGHIAVESTPGNGTLFRIRLPATRVDPPKPATPLNEGEPLRGRVLFMDDEEPIRIMTKALLERLGLEVVLTEEGGEAVRNYALARMNGKPFDLVIMDLTVPGAVGGAEAMREILKIDPKARGIVSSGYSSDPVMANFRDHGFRGMVPKPYRIADFARTIREVLSNPA